MTNLTTTAQNLTKFFLGTAFLLSLTACAGMVDRLNNVGKDPKMAKIENPVQQAGYQPVSMPMPAIRPQIQQPNSLWMSDRKGFFKDQRASQVGDILTILVEIKDTAKLNNKVERTKDATEDVDIPSVLGFQQYLNKALPSSASTNNLLNTSSASDMSGEGKIERDEEIELKIAAVITQILPNGNMVIHGKQQVRVNNERRDLEVAGIIRPEDINVTNDITYDKIAEARIAYGGQGMITDATRPRYGNEVMDIILPF